jgi:rubrerythrin
MLAYFYNVVSYGCLNGYWGLNTKKELGTSSIDCWMSTGTSDIFSTRRILPNSTRSGTKGFISHCEKETCDSMKKEIIKTLLISGLAEELQIVDNYTQIRELWRDDNVKATLGILIKESREHASIVGRLTTLIANERSWNLSEMDKKTAEKAAKGPWFRLTKEITFWYGIKLKGRGDVDIPRGSRLTGATAIKVLQSFAGCEREAHSTYASLAQKLQPGEQKTTIEKIAGDELRHESMLNELVNLLKKGS